MQATAMTVTDTTSLGVQFKATQTTPLAWTGDALAIGLCEGSVELTGELAELNDKLSGVLKELIDETEFAGKSGSTAVTRVGGGSPIRKIVLVGLGPAEELTQDTVRVAAASVARSAKKERCRTLGISLPVAHGDAAATAQAIVEGTILALHQDNRFKSEPEDGQLKLETVELLGLGGQEAAIARGEKVCSGTILARELVSAPANTVTPVTLAELAESLATDYGLEIEMLERDECEKRGMGAFLGVAQASDLPPKFIHLTYRPDGTPRRRLAVIGKGLTFDSGGLNLKPTGSGIETMKMDMGGAAATFGTAKAIAQLKPDVEVHFISAVTENMISGRAMRPGDILKASNGKTIEVNNTDAEGRLTLADALVFTEKLGLDAMVDVATLTGACLIALGNRIAGLWSPEQWLADELKQGAERGGEQLWQMPLESKYFELLKSPIADMKNAGSRPAGSITAALFLQQFVEQTPWAHIDIAGTALIDKEDGVNNAGATGIPVRTLVNWILA